MLFENIVLFHVNMLGKERVYRSWRYELYSRIVGIAITHHKINLYTITGFRGGIQRQNFKKNVFNSTVINTTQRLRTWMNRHGPSRGCHSSLCHSSFYDVCDCELVSAIHFSGLMSTISLTHPALFSEPCHQHPQPVNCQ